MKINDNTKASDKKISTFLNKKNLKIFASVLITIFLIIGGIKCADKILRNNLSHFKYDPFLKNKTDYDVLFYGSSHVINAIFPMQLWEDYGITSYNLSMHSCGVAANYEILEQSLKYHKPKVIVLDVLLPNGTSNTTKVGSLHNAYDAFPLNFSKFRYLYALSKEREDISLSEFVFPFSLYHSRWSEKNIKFQTLFSHDMNREMGAESRIAVATPNNFKRLAHDVHNDPENLPNLEKFIQYCKKKKIPLVLVYIPYPADQNAQKWANTCSIVAQNYDVPYIDLFDQNLVDFQIDCYDGGSHLNPSGARKVTDYLGQYLASNYSLSDKKENPKYAKKWNAWYEDYRNLLKENLIKQNNFKNILMLLNNSNFTAEVKFSERYTPDSIEKKLLNQVNQTVKEQNVDYKKMDFLDAIVEVTDVKTGETFYKAEFYKESNGNLKKFDRHANQENIKKAQEQNKLTARFDIKNSGEKENTVKILTNSSKTNFESPKWFIQKDGSGKMLQCNDKSIDFSFECVGDGKVEVILRGRDWKDLRGVRIPMKVDYTKLVINGEKVITSPKTVYHDAPFKWQKQVKDGEVITVHAEWKPTQSGNN